MGLLDRFRGKKNENPTTTALQETGTTVIPFERLDGRVTLQETVNKEMEMQPDEKLSAKEKLNFYVEHWRLAWNTFHTNMLPYLRAGSSEVNAKMTMALEDINADIEVAIIDNRKILEGFEQDIQNIKTTKDKALKDALINAQQETVINFRVSYIERAGKKFVALTTPLCWVIEDVNTPKVIVVQSIMPPMPGQYGETMTGSGGRTSEDDVRHPKGGPYDKRQKNTVD